jgi:hypothetical protein
MPDRPIRKSSSNRIAGNQLRPRAGGAVEPMLPPLLRGVIFIVALAVPFVAALMAG